jgi:hypothetical protein
MSWAPAATERRTNLPCCCPRGSSHLRQLSQNIHRRGRGVRGGTWAGTVRISNSHPKSLRVLGALGGCRLGSADCHRSLLQLKALFAAALLRRQPQRTRSAQRHLGWDRANQQQPPQKSPRPRRPRRLPPWIRRLSSARCCSSRHYSRLLSVGDNRRERGARRGIWARTLRISTSPPQGPPRPPRPRR